MSDIPSVFHNAQLALAAYASLSAGDMALPVNIDALVGPTGVGMALTQATVVAKSYPTILTSFDDQTTGLQVAVFKDSVGDLPGNLTVAFRGTQLPEDLASDLEVLTAGAAYSQIVAMANWWLRASTPAGQTVQQYRLTSYALADVPPDAVVIRTGSETTYVLDTAPSVASTGELAAALATDADRRVDVTGHSLGGHLAMAFSSLFASQTGQVTVFNAPGFIDSSVNQAFFAKLGGSIPMGGSIINIAADEALTDWTPFNWIAGLYSRPGEQVNIAIENQVQTDESDPFSARNHSVIPLVDSLAVYKLLTDFSPGLSTADYKIILNQVSARTSASYERIVDSLQRLFGMENKMLPTGNSNREALYQAIYSDGVQQVLGPEDHPNFRGALRIVPSAPESETLLKQIRDSAGLDRVAYSFALVQLNAFVAFDVNEKGLYAHYQPGGPNAGELDAYDPTTNPQGLTAAYLTDRAAFLERKNWFNAQDINPVNPGYEFNGSDPSFLTENSHYVDAASGYTIAQGFDPKAPFGNIRRYYFGSSGSDAAAGGLLEDHLFAGNGIDFLNGDQGNDYLEGGAGFDVYRFGSGDGADTVLDADGEGLLLRGGAGLALAVKQAANSWAFGDSTFTKSGPDLVVSFGGASTDSITLKDFDFAKAQADRYVGIRLWEGRKAPTYVPPANVVSGGDETANSLMGTPYADFVQAFGGNDTVQAGAGDDVVEGGTGDDVLFGDADNDRLYGEAGRDTLDGGAGDDELHGGEGADILNGRDGDDLLAGGAGADVSAGDGGEDEIYAGEPLALAQAIALAETQAPSGARGDWLDGGEGSDLVVGSADDEQLMGGGGSDVMIGGAGDDNLVGDASRTLVALDTWAVTRETIDAGGSVTYRLSYNAGAQIEESPDGAGDFIYGGAGADWVFAGAGDDYVDGGSGGDVVFGEAGADVLLGAAGDDVLVGDNPGVVSGADEGDDYLDGGPGADKLYGNGGDDVLAGGPGDDILAGGAGRDTYFFSRGDGRDTVIDDTTAPEKSRFVFGAGFDARDLTVRPGSMLLDFGGEDAVDLVNFNPYDPNAEAQFESLTFADGSPLSFADVLAIGFTVDGTEGDDDGQSAPVLVGTAYNDHIRGLGGNDELQGLDGSDDLDGGNGDDRLFGMEGDDVLAGGEGDDVLAGGGGSDFLDGGAGDDALFGEAGDDTYAFGRDGGQDLVFEDDPTPGNLDRLVFAANVSPDDVSATHDAVYYGDLVLALEGTDDAITIVNQFADPRYQVEEVAFADGTVWTPATTPLLIQGSAGNDFLAGTPGPDVFDGLAGNDMLAGGMGNDTYRFGRGGGQDTITDYDSSAGNFDKVLFAADILPDEVQATRSGDDLVLELSGTAGRVTISHFFADDGATPYSVEAIKFAADGTVWDVATVKQLVLGGTPRDDTLTGYATDDTLFGLDGNDSLFGLGGDDTLAGGTGNDFLQGGAGDDTLLGGPGADSLYGEAGADRLDGGGAAPGPQDNLYGGEGDDTYLFARGYGRQLIDDAGATTRGNVPPAGFQGGLDTLEFAPDILPAGVRWVREGITNLTAYVGTDGSHATLWNYFLNDGESYDAIERIEFPADGTTLGLDDLKAIVTTPTEGPDTIFGFSGDDILSGLGGDDVLHGLGGDDVIRGGPGNDTVSGDTGNDTYLFDLGDGFDTIQTWDNTPGKVDRLVFGPGIAPADVSVGADASDALVLSVNGTADAVRLVDYMRGGSYSQVEEIRFADGTVWTEATIAASFFPVSGTAGDDTLTGTGLSDMIDALAGNDVVRGGNGNDTIDGGSGSDALYGEDGDDSLYAGSGDRKRAGISNDLYGGNGNDALFASDTSNDFLYGGDGNDLLLGAGGDDWLEGDAGRNLLSGGDGTDRLWGGGGNDLLAGGAGSDFIDGDRDNAGVTGRDIVLFNDADGQDAVAHLGAATALSIGGLARYAQLKLERNGDQLVLKTGGRNEIAFNDWYSGDATASRPRYLQIMAEGLHGYDPASSDPLLNRKVQVFDLHGLVAAFDQAHAAGRRFSVAEQLASFRVSGSDTEAYGGAIAYAYGTTGTLAALSTDALQSVIGAPEFGIAPQEFSSGAVAVAATAMSAGTLDAAGATPAGNEAGAALFAQWNSIADALSAHLGEYGDYVDDAAAESGYRMELCASPAYGAAMGDANGLGPATGIRLEAPRGLQEGHPRLA